MDKYIVSARKYRPSTFASVVGQTALTSTLKNAIATDRLAHAYLFCGSRGVGKTSCARIFAKTINCQHRTPDGDPCNQCDSCQAFNSGSSLNIVELDAASNNSVDDIRNLVEQVRVAPTNGKYRVFIIDEVHMLSSAAFNAFLKTLEEPPSYVVFILATTEKHKIIPTIVSRCQIYDFNRITISDMVDHLEYVAKSEGITAERSALGVIASKADGAMRDALSIFDQVAASSRGNITYRSAIDNLNVLDAAYYSRLVDSFLSSDVPAALLTYKEIRDHGFDSHAFVNGLAAYIRDLMVSREESTRKLVDTDEATLKLMAEQSVKCTPLFLYQAMSLCNDADLNYRQATAKTFLVELLLIKLCQLLSPSPIFSGNGEGQLKPIHAASQDAPMSATPAVGKAQDSESKPAAPNNTQRPRQEVVEYTPPPAPRPAPTGHLSAGRRRPMARPHTISISGPIVSHTEAPKPVDDTTKPSRTDSYTFDQLQQAWDAYMNLDPTRHILVNTMRANHPVADENEKDLFRVVVQNPGQLETFGDEIPALCKFIRDRLSNDNISFKLELNQGPTSPATWSEREIINYWVSEYANMKKFMVELKLSLT